MKKEALREKLEDAGVIQEGAFTLKSGETSDIYFDIKKAYGDPELFSVIISEISQRIPEEATCIAGSGHGGVPLAVGVSLKLNKKISIVRDGEKDHGTKKNIDGYIPNESDRVVIVDDVLSSGTSLRNTIENLENTTILKCVVVLKRGDAKNITHDIEYLLDTDNLKNKS